MDQSGPPSEPQDTAFTADDVSDGDHRYWRESNQQHSTSGQLHDPHLPGEFAEAEHVHVLPIWLLVIVFVSLLLLTLLNVIVSTVNVGPYNVWAALAIAAVEAFLVLFYYMHLRWDAPFNRMAIMAALMFVVLFIGICLLDAAEYRPIIQTPEGAPNVSATPSDTAP